MKKRILAALVAVAMVFSVCTLASAEEKEVVYSQDFEGTVDAAWDGFSVVADPLDATNKVVSHTDNNWGQKTSGFILENCDASQVYTIKLDVYGDAAHVELVYANNWDQVEMTDGTTTAKGIVTMATEHYAGVHVRPLANQWDTVAVKFSGATQYKFYLMTQPGSLGVNGGTVLLDNIEVYKGDVLDEVNEEIQAVLPTPTPAVDDEPSATAGTDATNAPVDGTPAVAGTPVATTAPTAVAGTPVATTAPTAVVGTPATTTAPTVTPTSTPKPPKKVKIKFKKKSVKIKKGKKVTLKVTLKNAKKAKFSVNKKGKKVVKLSKKKAKSVVVKGKKKGKATITAKAGNKKATCKVTVKK